MKIFAILLLLLICACSDDSTHCFKCTVTEDGQTSDFTRCDITQGEADDIERAGTVIDPEGIKHPFGTTLKKYTVCTKVD